MAVLGRYLCVRLRLYTVLDLGSHGVGRLLLEYPSEIATCPGDKTKGRSIAILLRLPFVLSIGVMPRIVDRLL